MVAACDRELLDKTLDERVFINPDFYGDESCSEAKLVEELAKCSIANLFGKKTVELAVKHGFVDEESLIFFAGVPHAQIVILF